MAPITIHKSLFGLVVINFVGFVLTGTLIVAAFYAPTEGLEKVYGIGVILVLFGTFVEEWVYNRSTVIISDAELRVTTWPTLFFSNVAVCSWREVEDVDVRKTSIFGQIADFGDLLVQTAGTERNLRIRTIGNVEHWRDVIATRANDAVTPVKES